MLYYNVFDPKILFRDVFDAEGYVTSPRETLETIERATIEIAMGKICPSLRRDDCGEMEPRCNCATVRWIGVKYTSKIGDTKDRAMIRRVA